MCQTSRVLKVNQALLDDLVNLVLCNQTKIFSACDGQNFSVFLGIFIFAQADKCSSFRVDAFNGLASFTDDESNQSDWNFHFDFVRPIDGSTVHLSLSLNDHVEFFSDSFN